jgi:prepilin-type N-terminal cleavage/methylation domain-containing protein
MPLNSTRRAGFSLLELSVVLAILGLLTAGGLSIGGIMVAQQANTSTNENLDEIQQALIDFVKTQGRLPCVAPLTVDPANTTPPIFGTELAAGGCLSTTTASGGTLRAVDGTRIVRIGGVPTRTLGLKDRMASDEFGNRFLYVVTESLTIKTTTDPNVGFSAANNLGAIGVRDGSVAVNFILDPASANGGAAFMLISHGPDGKGAVRHKTNNVTNACGTGSNLDVENCNLSSTDITFRDTRFNNGDLPASFFDDFTRFMPKYRLTALAGSTGSSLWGNNGDNIFSIGSDNNTTTGNVGIGTATPVSPFEIVMDNRPGGITNDIVWSRYENTNDWSPITTRRARGTAAAPANLQNGDGLSGILEFGYVNGAFTELNRIVGWYEGNGTTALSAMRFETSNTERMRINSAGNVGIGTTTPANRLHIGDGGDGWANGFTIHSNYPTLYLRDSDNYSAMLHLNGDHFFILRGGSSNPVDGNNWAVNWTGWWPFYINVNTNDAVFGGNVTIRTHGTLSDRRLKTDIHPLQKYGVETVMALQPASFKLKDFDDKTRLGFIAQDMQKVIPELVYNSEIRTGNPDKPTITNRLAVEYNGLLPVLTRAIQDLKHENDGLKAHQQDLKHENDALKARLNALDPAHAKAPSVAAGVAQAAPAPISQALIVLLSLFVGAGVTYFALRRRSA